MTSTVKSSQYVKLKTNFCPQKSTPRQKTWRGGAQGCDVLLQEATERRFYCFLLACCVQSCSCVIFGPLGPPCCSWFTACGFTSASLSQTEMFCCNLMCSSVIQLRLAGQNTASVSPPPVGAADTQFVCRLACCPPRLGVTCTPF